jgi:hypothetical protein
MTQRSTLAVDPKALTHEFYETPRTFSKYLFSEVSVRGRAFEPCVGSGAIVTASEHLPGEQREWVTSDLDHAWTAYYYGDATGDELWREVTRLEGPIDWTVTNPPFEPAIDILTQALPGPVSVSPCTCAPRSTRC